MKTKLKKLFLADREDKNKGPKRFFMRTLVVIKLKYDNNKTRFRYHQNPNKINIYHAAVLINHLVFEYRNFFFFNARLLLLLLYHINSIPWNVRRPLSAKPEMDDDQQHHDLVRDGDAQVRVVTRLQGRPNVVIVVRHTAAAAAGLQQPPSLSPQHRIPAHISSRFFFQLS